MVALRTSPNILVIVTIISVCSVCSALSAFRETATSAKLLITTQKRSMLEQNKSFILAAERTHRRDPLNAFRFYTDGWNISNRHYLASVGFSAAPLFSISVVWLLVFGLALALICCCYYCFPKQSHSFYSRTTHALSFILLILFTVLTVIGCAILFDGQRNFHRSTSRTLDFIEGQSNSTVFNLRNFSSDLMKAENVGVGQASLSSDQKARIDSVVRRVHRAADQVSSKTSENTNKIRNYLDKACYTDRNCGCSASLGCSWINIFNTWNEISCVYVSIIILVIVGWLLVAATFFLSGLFLLFHNAISDTCLAMDEWAVHPQEHSAMDDILPCVDEATAGASLDQSKQVTFELVDVVNRVIVNVSNVNYPPNFQPLYYNQSGPLVPLLCNPFNTDLTNRTCLAGELSFDDAARVWSKYVCRVRTANGFDTCWTVGRLTPAMYRQMTSATEVGSGLYMYGAFLVGLVDCSFVRAAFRSISVRNCPGLGRYSKRVYEGLVVASAAVMAALVDWVVLARSRWRRTFEKKVAARSQREQLELQRKNLLQSQEED
ncbi:uncharacterized protein LOC121972729 [Zingiber officinale]|uniref:uncharacterized protein LOC121972729 n=1 Tax=Zingiber officinale TaxID=94328 RepID=UPI001C4C51F2|nr:uncharacterized protein LOC121972729 [Zingiber officinale]